MVTYRKKKIKNFIPNKRLLSSIRRMHKADSDSSLQISPLSFVKEEKGDKEKKRKPERRI